MKERPKERPIAFAPEMIRAILADRKTQTRRARTHAKQGDRLWVREGFCGPTTKVPPREWHADTPIWYCADGPSSKHKLLVSTGRTKELRLNDCLVTYGPAKPAMFMPRRFSRLLLEVTAVNHHRLLDISEGDAVAEGFENRAAFLSYFDQLHSGTIPEWVWAIHFRRIR